MAKKGVVFFFFWVSTTVGRQALLWAEGFCGIEKIGIVRMTKNARQRVCGGGKREKSW